LLKIDILHEKIERSPDFMVDDSPMLDFDILARVRFLFARF
jgi:hypothetical protein